MSGITDIATIALTIISSKASAFMSGNIDMNSLKNSMPKMPSNGESSREGIDCLLDDSDLLEKNKSKLNSIKSEIREKKKKQNSDELSTLDKISYTNQLVDLGCGLNTINSIFNLRPY